MKNGLDEQGLWMMRGGDEDRVRLKKGCKDVNGMG
jgi:hypothetical protein